MKQTQLLIIVGAIILILPLLISSKEIRLFENTSTEANLTFFNPGNGTENSTFVWFPPWECAYDSKMTLSSDYLDFVNDSPYEVVLVTDLSNSMDYCIIEPFFNETIALDESYMFADLVGEGSFWNKWEFHNGDWERREDAAANSFVIRQNLYLNDNDDMPIALLKGMRFGNFTADFKALVSASSHINRYSQFNFGRTTQNRLNAYAQTGTYSVRFTTNNHVQLFRREVKVAQTLSIYPLNTYQDIKVTVDSGSIKVFVNGTNMIDWSGSDVHGLGFLSFSTNDASFSLDDLYIKSLDHNYTATKPYGYSSWVSGNAYLYKDIDWSPISQGECLNYTVEWPPAMTSCGNEDFCSVECASWSSPSASSCWSQPLCYSWQQNYGSYIYCSTTNPSWHSCCNLDPSQSGDTNFPGNCCDATYASAASCESENAYDTAFHDNCNSVDWGGGNQLVACRTRRGYQEYCNGGYDPYVKGTCSDSTYSANCVDPLVTWCYSYQAPVSQAMCQTTGVVRNYWSSGCPGNNLFPSSSTDTGWRTECDYGGACGDPDIRCQQNLQKTTTTCGSFYDSGSTFCMNFASDGGTYYIWTRDYQARERQYRDCQDPDYQWIVKRYRPYTTMYSYCLPNSIYYRYCAVKEGNYYTKNDFFSPDFDDGEWGRLYDYIRGFYNYYVMMDGYYYIWGNDYYINSWECKFCSRFYRKEFNLTENVAFQKPVSVISGSGCSGSGLSRLTDGSTSTGNVLDCGTGNTDTLQVDLGGNFNITALNVIFDYTSTDRRSNYLTILVSNHTDFATWGTVIYNSSESGPILSTPEGPMIGVPSGIDARYVRVVAQGTISQSPSGTVTTTTSNRIIEIEAFTPLPTEEVTSLTLFTSHRDGMICYLNGELVAYNSSYGWDYNGWGQTDNIKTNLLVNGTNLLACQVKKTEYTEGFNAELKVNVNTSLIHRASDFRFKQQETLCASEETWSAARQYNPFDFSTDPGGSSCEYHDEVASCEGFYPYDITSKLGLIVTGWTTSGSITYLNDGLFPVAENLAMMLGAELGALGESDVVSEIPLSVWEGDIVIVDGDTTSTSQSTLVSRIGQLLSEGKVVITEYDRTNYLRGHSAFSFGPMRYASSFDLYSRVWNVTYSNATHSGTGVLISDQLNELARRWSSSSYLNDRRDKSAHFIDALHPVWKNSSLVSSPVPQSAYCLQTKKNSGCEICIGEKDKLAVLNDLFFLNLTVGQGNTTAKVGLVTFGSDADTCPGGAPLSDNATLLNDIVKRYDPGCGETCLSCAIKKSMEVLAPYIGNNVTDNIVLMTDGLANTLISGANDEVLARQEALQWACDTSFISSAASRNVTIHTIYYGSNLTEEGRIAMSLMQNISLCTGGVFTSGDDPDELEDAYRRIIGNLSAGYPRPQIRFGENSSIPWDFTYQGAMSFKDPITWWNRSCGSDAECINLMTAFNREIMECAKRDLMDYDQKGCTVRINVSTNISGIVVLSALNVTVINSSRDPVAYIYELPPEFEIQMCPLDTAECGNGILDHQFGEECENVTHCGGAYCVPPMHGGECTCASPAPGTCGNGIVEAGEQCDSLAAFNDFSCYPPGSVIHPPGYAVLGYDLSCRIRSGAQCGNGVLDPGEECDPSAPAPFGDDACPGNYRCILPGVDTSCTCVNPSWNVQTAGGTMHLAVPERGTLTDINLLNHAVSPLFTRDKLLWSVSPSTDPAKADFTVTGTFLRTHLGEGHGLVNVTVWVHDPLGNNDSFNISVNITEFYPVTHLMINSTVIATSNKIIDSYFEDYISGRMTGIGPYLFTMKVYRDE